LTATHTTLDDPQVLRHRDGLGRRDGLDRHTGGNIAEHWQLESAMTCRRRQQFDRAAAIPRTPDEALFLEIRQVLLDRGERRQAEAASDLLQLGA
jgi:hypothetical protein